MAKIGSMELIVILIVALFAIGPERLPKAARVLGRAVGSFKKYMNEATSELREVSEEFKDVTNEIASAQKTMAAKRNVRPKIVLGISFFIPSSPPCIPAPGH